MPRSESVYLRTQLLKATPDKSLLFALSFKKMNIPEDLSVSEDLVPNQSELGSKDSYIFIISFWGVMTG